MANESSVGFRVFTRVERPGADVLALFKDVESTHVSDVMHRFFGMDSGIGSVIPGVRVVGPAVTVRARPGDNLMVYKAMEIAAEGDVLVIEQRGFTTTAVWGDLTSLIGKRLKLGGMVTDGGVRDVEGIRAVGFPVFARAASSPQGGDKNGPGEVNVPIACGGVPVLPGDVIVADWNGVTVVPRADAGEVGRRAIEVLGSEKARVEAIETGPPVPASVDETLRQKGCLIQ